MMRERFRIETGMNLFICIECGRTLTRFDDFTKESFIKNDMAQEVVTCADCLSLRNTFFINGFTYGCLFDDLRILLRGSRNTLDLFNPTHLTPHALEIVRDLTGQNQGEV